MSDWRPKFRPEHFYFVTTSAVDSLHIFRRDVIKRLLVDTLDCFCHHKRMRLFGFVIMPNHLHFIARFSATDPMASVVRDFKRQTADRVIRHLKAEENQTALVELRARVKRLEKQRYKVWEDGYNAKDVVSETFLLQKMEYIHNNPCQPHWSLCKKARVLYLVKRAVLYDEFGVYYSDRRCA
ncbi:MAG: transposase [Candidatus Poribacteria bacterium]|nr:transposase [Candidatus Poribacteria bacterium]MDE0503144.1 transposase [Candidatus Poribacteria bacterium]